MSTITDLSQLKADAVYSYADYLGWKLEQAVELIRGKILKMSPAPKTRHQRIAFNLSGLFYVHLKKSDCQAFAAPFDVRLPDRRKSAGANQDIFTVVQPDLCVICDASKIDENGCLGAPDLVVEILSKGNANKEMRLKFELYEEAGVREYWVADPERQLVHLFQLGSDERYLPAQIFLRDDVLQSAIFPDLRIDLREVFPKEIADEG